MIPEDWEVKKLEEIVDFLDGRRRPVKDSVRAKMRGQFPYYGASGIVDYVNDYLFDDDLILLGEDGENILSRNCRLAFRVRGQIWVNNHAHVLKAKPNIDTGFLVDLLESLNYEQYNTGTAQPKLNKQVCSNIPIPLPPTFTEQTAIATVLSNADALIQSIEKLIAKKSAIKQGAMQKLLKHKKGWVVKKIPHVCWFQEGPGVRNSQFTSCGVKLLNGTNIDKGVLILEKTDRYISETEAFGWYSHFLAEAGDIIIACSGISVDKFHEKVTEVDEIHLPLCMNTSTMRFKVTSQDIIKSYLLYFLKSKSLRSK